MLQTKIQVAVSPPAAARHVLTRRRNLNKPDEVQGQHEILQALSAENGAAAVWQADYTVHQRVETQQISKFDWRSHSIRGRHESILAANSDRTLAHQGRKSLAGKE